MKLDGEDIAVKFYKSDFKKLTANTDGEIKLCGELRISDLYAPEYAAEQNIKSGKFILKTERGSVEMFVSPDNCLYLELNAPQGSSYPSVTLDIPDEKDSQTFSYAENGINWHMKKYSGREVSSETDIAFCSRRFPTVNRDGNKIVRFCISAVSNSDSKSYTAEAIARAMNGDYRLAEKDTQKSLQNLYSNLNQPFKSPEAKRIYLKLCYLMNVFENIKTIPMCKVNCFTVENYRKVVLLYSEIDLNDKKSRKSAVRLYRNGVKEHEIEPLTSKVSLCFDPIKYIESLIF